MTPGTRSHEAVAEEVGQDHPRCNVWWLWTVLGSVMLLAMAWACWLSERSMTASEEIKTAAVRVASMDKDVDEMKADIKELLRRVPK